MPIVHIDLRKGRDAVWQGDIGRVLCEAMVGKSAKSPRFRPENAFAKPSELKKQAWSFGNDIAQCAT